MITKTLDSFEISVAQTETPRRLSDRIYYVTHMVGKSIREALREGQTTLVITVSTEEET